jgi:hypothetical protein
MLQGNDWCSGIGTPIFDHQHSSCKPTPTKILNNFSWLNLSHFCPAVYACLTFIEQFKKSAPSKACGPEFAY